MDLLRIRLDNIHCDDCRAIVTETLSHQGLEIAKTNNPELETIPDAQQSKENTFSIVDKDVTIYGPEIDPKRLVRAIAKRGFKVLSWDYNGTEGTHAADDVILSMWLIWSKLSNSRRTRKHLEHCSYCQNERKAAKLDADSDNTVVGVTEKTESEYRVVFTVEGMTCASCVTAVESTISAVLTDFRAPTDSFSVNLILHSAVVILPNKQLINRIIDAVTALGFDCKVIEALPVERSVNTKVTAILGGITCAACATAIHAAVSELQFVLECGINPVTKTGVFVMEDGAENLKKLKDTVEDCGFDFELISTESINYALKKTQSRTINVAVDGMFCGHCPDVITEYLNSFGEAVVVEDPITLAHPFIKFTYIPKVENDITVRRFIHDLNYLVATEEGFKISETKGPFGATLVENVSMDEHLRRLSKREVWTIARRLIIATVVAIPTFIFGIVAMSLLPKANNFRKWVEEPLWVGNVSRNTWILFILSTPVYFFAADIFHIKAFMEVRSLWLGSNTSWSRRLFRFGLMNLLMCLGTSVSYFASIVLLILSSRQAPMTHMGIHTTYFDLVVFLTFFLLIGRLLESLLKNKTADSIANLSKLKKTEATLLSGEVVELKFLETGDQINIVSGDSPPVDCTILEGISEFDELALTGESRPVKHFPGHQIFLGTVNVGSASVVAKVNNLDGDSLIDQIVNTVRDGQLRKAPIARTADKLTSFFVPLITLIAILTWVIWLALGYGGVLPDRYLDIEIGGWAVWSLEFCIAVFVIACPCGIGLAAPTALFVGSGLAAKYGILPKGGGVAFQDGAKTSVVCFDKTGTLTYGELRVTDFAFGSGYTPDIATIAVQGTRDLEILQKHPLAQAVRQFVKSSTMGKYSLSIQQNKIPQVTTVAGKGVIGDFVLDGPWMKNPTHAILGNEKLMKDYGVHISSKEAETFDKWKRERKSIVLVAIRASEVYGDDKHHLALSMACRDQVRAEARGVLEWLERSQIECWMITGDNSLTASAIGAEIGIPSDRIISEVLPDEKQAQVKKIQSKVGRNRTVAMVGDGINDAPAMAAADVGIALLSGADLAVNLSDFIILNKELPLATLVTLLDLLRVVFRRVKFNFGWSLVYNTIGIPIAAGVIYPYHNSRLSPVWASAAMALLSISVVTSSLALRFYRPKVFKVEERGVDEGEAKEVII